MKLDTMLDRQGFQTLVEKYASIVERKDALALEVVSIRETTFSDEELPEISARPFQFLEQLEREIISASNTFLAERKVFEQCCMPRPRPRFIEERNRRMY